MSKMSKIKIALQNLLMSFASVTTDKGILSWDGDEELVEGSLVFITDENGERVKAEDGEYLCENGDVIVVVENAVKEIVAKAEEVEEPEEEEKPAEPETPAEEEPVVEEEPVEEEKPAEEETEEPETPAEEPVEEEPAEEEDAVNVEDLQAQIAALTTENEALKAEIERLKNEPAAKPIQEEYEQIVNKSKTGDKRLDNIIKVMSAE